MVGAVDQVSPAMQLPEAHPRRKRWARPVGFGLVVAILVGIYGPLLRADPLLERDDRRLVEPLESVSSLGGYFEALRTGRILDVQPVRDFSFKVDLLIRARTGWSPFHFTNLVLWCAILLVVQRIAVRALGAEPRVFGLLAAFAVHPVFVNSVAWVAARKHLLSALFILLATLVLLAAEKRPVSRARLGTLMALYALSLGSQPINLLWPAYGALHLRNQGRRPWGEPLKLLAFCAPLALVAAAVNLGYYSGDYLAQTGAAKFVDAEGTGGVALLSLGRYFANLVIPVALATQYYPGSLLNVVGLLGLVLFAAASLKWQPKAFVLEWLAFFALPLAVVTARMTAIFVSDTYLLTPAVGMLCLAGKWLAGPASRGRAAVIWAGLAVCASAGSALSIRQAATWMSEPTLWAHAVEVEPTPNALAKHSFYLARQGRAEEALEYAERLRQWSPDHQEVPLVFSKAVYLAPTLSPEKKLELLQASDLAGRPWPSYFAGLILADQGRQPEAYRMLRRALSAPGTFKGELPLVAAQAKRACELAGEAGCGESIDRLLIDGRGRGK